VNVATAFVLHTQHPIQHTMKNNIW